MKLEPPSSVARIRLSSSGRAPGRASRRLVPFPGIALLVWTALLGPGLPRSGFLGCASPASAADADSAKAPALRVETLPDGRVKLGPMILDEKEGVLDVPARVNMSEGMIEVLACAPWGKTHESLLVLEAEPYLVQVGLLLLFGLPPKAVGLTTDTLDYDSYKPVGPRLRLRIGWTDGKGNETVFPVERWICKADSEQNGQFVKMDEGDWVFTGSILNKSGFAAQTVGTVVATYNDPSSIVGNPRSDGNNDDAYLLCSGDVPERGTKVTLKFLRSPSGGGKATGG